MWLYDTKWKEPDSKAAYCMIHLHEISRKGKFTETDSNTGFWGLGAEAKLNYKRTRKLGVEKSIVKLDCSDSCTGL
jgi:hypothetical protein